MASVPSLRAKLVTLSRTEEPRDRAVGEVVEQRLVSETDPPAAAEGFSHHRLRESVRIATERYLRALGDDPPGDLYRLLLAEVEAPLFEAVLRHYRGNQTRAAQALGISRVTLRKKLRQLDGAGR